MINNITFTVQDEYQARDILKGIVSLYIRRGRKRKEEEIKNLLNMANRGSIGKYPFGSVCHHGNKYVFSFANKFIVSIIEERLCG
jgi:hypothetical protein